MAAAINASVFESLIKYTFRVYLSQTKLAISRKA